MKFKIPFTDLRSQHSGGTTIEDENGKTVGQFFYGGGSGLGRAVLLFGNIAVVSRHTTNVKRSLTEWPPFLLTC
jgi:hypothetical protein